LDLGQERKWKVLELIDIHGIGPGGANELSRKENKRVDRVKG